MEINHAAPPLLAKERLSDSEGSRHIGLLSSVLANIPVVAVSILMVKGYLVVVEAVPEAALGAHFTDWPAATIPVFVAIAMMFGATLGGNAALIGTAANTVSVGICAHHGNWSRLSDGCATASRSRPVSSRLVLFYFMR